MPSTPRIGRRKRNNLIRLNHCFSNLMQPFTPQPPPTSPTNHDIDHNRPSPPTTTSPIMLKNFNTLYDYDHTIALQYSISLPTTTFEPEPESEPADFASAFASQRFFFSSPGRSNSIVESTSNKTDCTPPSSSSSSSLMATAPPAEDESAAAADDDNNNDKKKKNKQFLNGSVAVSTYSPDPYLEFRRSMQEMVEARPELMDLKSNWDVLQELLLCYLSLNPKSTHKFILGAFADLLVSLMSFSFSSSSSSSSSPPPQNPNPGDVSASCR